MRSGNPTLSTNTFTDPAIRTVSAQGNTMTIMGTVHKTSILLALTFIGAIFTWTTIMNQIATGTAPGMGWMALGGIGGFVLAMITVFKKTAAPITAPIYAVFEGLLLGSISALIETRYPGIVTQAILGTFGVFATMLLLYKFRIVQATERFKLGVLAATGGIALVYMISFVLSFFGTTIPYIHESGKIGIIFSLVTVGIASLNLVLDLDLIEQGERAEAPKFMEWYGAFALLVTLIWLYFEILRLLTKLNSRK